jgi:hypothetical protein
MRRTCFTCVPLPSPSVAPAPCSPVGRFAVWLVVESPSALFHLIQSINRNSEIALVFRGKSRSRLVFFPFPHRASLTQFVGWNKHGKFNYTADGSITSRARARTHVIRCSSCRRRAVRPRAAAAAAPTRRPGARRPPPACWPSSTTSGRAPRSPPA